MSIEELNTMCIARRVRLSRERRATLLATVATLAVFTFVVTLAFGGLTFR